MIDEMEETLTPDLESEPPADAKPLEATASDDDHLDADTPDDEKPVPGRD